MGETYDTRGEPSLAHETATSKVEIACPTRRSADNTHPPRKDAVGPFLIVMLSKSSSIGIVRLEDLRLQVDNVNR